MLSASVPIKIRTADGMLLVTKLELTKQGDAPWSISRAEFEGVTFARRGHGGDGNEVQLHVRDGNRFPLYGVRDADVLRLIEALGYQRAAVSSPARLAPPSTGDATEDADETALLMVSCAQGWLTITRSRVRLTGEDQWELRRADVTEVHPRVTPRDCDLVLVADDGQKVKATKLTHVNALKAIRLLSVPIDSAARLSLAAEPDPPEPSRQMAQEGRRSSSAERVAPDDTKPEILKPEILQPDVERADVERADVERADVERADVERADVERADVERADVERADVERADDRREPPAANPVAADVDRAAPPSADGARGFDGEARRPIWRVRKVRGVALAAALLLSLMVAWVIAVFRPENPIAFTLAPTATLPSPASMIYVGSHDGSIYALAARNGTLVWRYTTGGAVESCPTYAEGVVYVGSDDGSISAMRVTDHAILWQVRTGGKVIGAPAVAGGVVYVGSADGSLYALRAGNGSSLWRYTTHNWFASQPTVAGGLVYAGNYDGNI